MATEEKKDVVPEEKKDVVPEENAGITLTHFVKDGMFSVNNNHYKIKNYKVTVSKEDFERAKRHIEMGS